MIDLKDFEKKLILRNLRMQDFDDLVKLQLTCFPKMKPWTKKQIQSQLKIFPEGQIVVEYDSKLVASSSSLIINLSFYEEDCNWNELSDEGYIRNHDPHGDTLYGMEIMVDPQYRNMRLARRLYDARKDIARKYNLLRIMIGGRIPGYQAYRDQMSAREYVDKVLNKEIYDSVLTTQLSNSFVLKRIISHYLDSDMESRGFATYLEWANLDYLSDKTKHFLPTDHIRICIVQFKMGEITSVNDFIKRCELFIESASKYKCDFILFPERLTSQLLVLSDETQPSIAIRQLSNFTSHYLETFSSFALKYSINIIGGSHIVLEKNKLHNIAYLFRRDGTIDHQYKLNISLEEQRWWGIMPGNKVEVFETDRAKISIQIGCDIQFPDISQRAVAKGAQIIFVPFCTENQYANLRIKRCAQARAIENQVYVASAGGVGIIQKVNNTYIHHSQSGIYTPADIPFPKDAIAALCEPNIETIEIKDLDLKLLKNLALRTSGKK